MQHLVIYSSQPSGHPLGDVSIAERLRDIGYKTAMVGKWHLGFFQSEYTPSYRGFDTFYGNVFSDDLQIVAMIFKSCKPTTLSCFYLFCLPPCKSCCDDLICQECTMELETISPMKSVPWLWLVPLAWIGI